MAIEEFPRMKRLPPYVFATVNALKLSQGRARRGISGYQRASDLSALAGAPVPGERGEIFYITLPSSAGMEALWSVLNSWKSVPVKFFEAAAWVFGLRSAGATNISPFGLFVLFSEFSRLNSSNFIVTEASRSGPEEAQPDGAAARPVVRVEVFNAAGQKDLAAATSKYLRAEGFDVLTAASYGKIEINTRILCFSGEPAAALKLRSALGLEGLEIHMRASKKSVAQAAVILGTDFNGAVLGKARPVKQ